MSIKAPGKKAKDSRKHGSLVNQRGTGLETLGLVFAYEVPVSAVNPGKPYWVFDIPLAGNRFQLRSNKILETFFYPEVLTNDQEV